MISSLRLWQLPDAELDDTEISDEEGTWESRTRPVVEPSRPPGCGKERVVAPSRFNPQSDEEFITVSNPRPVPWDLRWFSSN
jgi:hypothetical protein